MITYRIRDWLEHFENNRTREMKRMLWVPIPCKLAGDGYTQIMEHPDGAAIYGAWCACVIVAASAHPRGTLLRAEHVPHDSSSIARITRMPKKTIDRMLEVCVSIGWLDTYEQTAGIPHHPAENPQRAAVPVSIPFHSIPDSSSSSEEDARAKDCRKTNEQPTWNGEIGNDYRQRLLAAWKPTGTHASAHCLRNLRHVLDGIACNADLGMGAQMNAPEWLLARVAAYADSYLGKAYPKRTLGGWLKEQMYLQTDEQWARVDFAPPAPRKLTAADRLRAMNAEEAERNG